MRRKIANILSEISSILNRAGFTVYTVLSDYCVQVVAKKNDTRLLLRAVINVDNEKKEVAENLGSLAAVFSATPLIISNRYQIGSIEDGIIHERFNINVINLNTFKDSVLYGRYPIAYAKRGGMYFKINGQKLRKLRMERRLSLGELAAMLGVSRKTIYEYENSDMGATLRTALRMREIFDEDVTMEINIFDLKHDVEIIDKSPSGNIAKQLHNKLKKIGCKTIGLNSAPIDVHAKDLEVSFLTDEGLDNEALNIKIEDAVNIGKILEIDPVLVTKRGGGNFNITAISIDEVKKIESKRELEQKLKLN
ncbi:MAG: helix-turn-helix domain-containing protein [Candidatus Methanomethyliaceae archaeon]|nr:helix-turn-helix domain-containing protein [Candidatus Methanomethyliaceae archaeon]MCX8170256.1 helix-turn-helix domain-containing protein [Candidatus Methanomethyliaceae archaeon]MDW7970900.1 helix-turn-helix domain-containing protein [Nitrososphaerota archaeon]